ncbi:ATP:cob(I)alamin adenosyltransferase [bacterium]|nr:ATP:cob(I)alamin adenosyltransferase [bacterium]|tara:strand:- start:32856 stop:33437 length:582 start_codon:yes stop_codon:yes gene_type:complete
MAMLYTGKGDKGTTKFFSTTDGSSKTDARVNKNHPVVECLGALDELNSFIGLCKVKSIGNDSVVNNLSVEEILEMVQQNLFMVQAEVAGDADKRISREKIKDIEKIVDAIEKEIPPITSFTVVGGMELSALLDVARTIARRTERGVVGVCNVGEQEICEDALAYMNRLSSLLFALARFVNHKAGIKEKSPTYE